MDLNKVSENLGLKEAVEFPSLINLQTSGQTKAYK